MRLTEAHRCMRISYRLPDRRSAATQADAFADALDSLGVFLTSGL